MAVVDELVAAERRGWEALTTPYGADYYERHMTDNAMMVFPSGVMTRADALRAMRSITPWTSFEILEPDAYEPAASTGLVVYRAKAQRAGEPLYKALVSSVYVQDGPEWLLAFHQQTPELSPPGSG